MNRERVALGRCREYRRDLVEAGVEQLFDLLGGPGAVAGEGERVFLKTNTLLPAAASSAAVTHPEVVRAVVKQFRRVTDSIVIGDSPGGPFNQALLKRAYQVTGLAQVAEETGARLSYDTRVVQKTCPESMTTKEIFLCRSMVECDRLVSLCKFKTHLLVNMTCAIKNMFGAVPGMNKFTYHARYQDGHDFARLLVDVCQAAEADFHLVDAVVSMEGNGPRKGPTRQTGILAASTSPYAVDTLMAHLAGVDPRVNLALGAAIERGLCTGKIEDIEVLGDDPQGLMIPDLQLPEGTSGVHLVPSFFMKRYGLWMVLRPEVDAIRCDGCRKCYRVCPAGAISMRGGLPRVDHRTCTRCYCCCELCEPGAMDARRPFLMRLFNLGR